MSLFGALFSGVSGLNANSQAMGIIADNITNVNTIGYKNTTSQFSTIVAQSLTSSKFAPGGVRSVPGQLIDRQGVLQSSSSPLDLAISGRGFFVANTNADHTTGETQFTRAGSFRPDENGFLRNSAGLYIQGWPADDNGLIADADRNFSKLETIVIGDLGLAVPTTSARLQANLRASQPVSAFEAAYNPIVAGNNMASGAVTADFERSIQIVDSQGTSRTVNFAYLKSSTPNEWHVEIYVQPAADVTMAPPLTNGQVATGTIGFNPDGSLDTGATNLPSTLIITWTPGSTLVTNSTVKLNFGTDNKTDGFTQFEAPSELITSDVNGAPFARLSSISVNEDGDVNALFANGVVKRIYQIPVATFQNPNGLANKTGNAYARTDNSGDFTLKNAGSGAGKIAPGSLESSTVDIAEEFTNMITVQRAYSAASRVITTADDMLDELIRIKR